MRKERCRYAPKTSSYGRNDTIALLKHKFTLDQGTFESFTLPDVYARDSCPPVEAHARLILLVHEPGVSEIALPTDLALGVFTIES